MQDITEVKVLKQDGELVGMPGRMIIGIQLPVAVKVTLSQDADGWHGCTLEMADTLAMSLLSGLEHHLSKQSIPEFCPLCKHDLDERRYCSNCNTVIGFVFHK